MEENYSKADTSTEKQVFLSESEELSKDEPPADFDISIEELTAKLAEKKKVELKKREEEKIVLEVREEFEKTSEESKPFQIQINEEEEKPKSFSIKIEEEKHETEEHKPIVEKAYVQEPQKFTHKQTFNPRKNFLQRHKWIIAFTILLIFSYFWFHPAENNLISSYTMADSIDEQPIKETVKEIPQTPAVEKIDLRQEKLRNLIVEGVTS